MIKPFSFAENSEASMVCPAGVNVHAPMYFACLRHTGTQQTLAEANAHCGPATSLMSFKSHQEYDAFETLYKTMGSYYGKEA